MKSFTVAEITRLVTYAIPHLVKEKIRLPLATGKLEALENLKTRFEDLKAKRDDPNQSTPVVLAAFKLILKEAQKDFREMQQYLKITQKGQLTGEDYTILGIHQDKTTATHNAIPTERLSLLATLQQHGLIRLQASFMGLPGNNKRTVLDGATNNTIELDVAFTDATDTATPPESDFNEFGEYTKSVFDVDFSLDQIGRRVFFRARLVNTTEEKGPWGDVVSYIVPG